MTVTETARDFARIKIDALGIALWTIFIGVMAASLAFYQYLAAPTSTGGGGVERGALATSSTATQTAAGSAWVTLEVLIAIAFIAIILAYRRLPAPLQTTIKNTLKGAVVLYAGAYSYGLALESSTPYSRLYLILVAGVFAGNLVNELDVWWLVNNAIVIGLVILVSTAAGFAVGIPVIIIGLVGLTAYDHYFANRSTAMFLIGGWFVKTRFPVLFVWPKRWRVDWDALADAMSTYEHDDTEHEDNEPDEVSWGIGMADIMLPSAFAVVALASTNALSVAGLPLVVWGVIVGTSLGVFRLRYAFRERSGAGLPALATGSIGGYLVALAIVGVATVI